jgi:hypothetical protein
LTWNTFKKLTPTNSRSRAPSWSSCSVSCMDLHVVNRNAR